MSQIRFLISLFILFVVYEIESSSICTVHMKVSKKGFFNQIKYTTVPAFRNCTHGCCSNNCCLGPESWSIIWILVLVGGALVFIGCVGAAIYYWKCRKPRQQYTIQPVSGLMQNQGVVYSPSPMYSSQPVGQPGYNPYLPQSQSASNPYGYPPLSVPQSGAYPSSSPSYNPPMPQPPSQQQPGAYPPNSPQYGDPMLHPPSSPYQQQTVRYPTQDPLPQNTVPYSPTQPRDAQPPGV